ncbi:unnamed protein product [Moneuplotes crassus]|uniref:Uncharacterized protein n=1 Tax=Euplotes crassus TaxID=5936 RepID=A0AAD1XP13_EUPCR|nr:unnamed protein product [Moneuplotes crassus]
MLLNCRTLKLSQVKPTKMISFKGKSTDSDFVMFKRGLTQKLKPNSKKVYISDDSDSLDKPRKIFSPEMLHKLNQEIIAKQKMRENKVVKKSSSFLSTSRSGTAPSLSYIKKGLKESPSVGRYSPRDINKKIAPTYSFTRKKRDTHLFLFTTRAGANNLFNKNIDYENFEKLLSSKHAMERKYYRTTLKEANMLKAQIPTVSRKRRILTARGRKKHNPKIKFDIKRPKTGLRKLRPKSCSKLSLTKSKSQNCLTNKKSSNTSNPIFITATNLSKCESKKIRTTDFDL